MQHLRDVQLMWFEVYQNFNVRPPDRHQPDRYQPMGYQQRQPPPRPMKALPAPPPTSALAIGQTHIWLKQNRTQSQPYISRTLQAKITNTMTWLMHTSLLKLASHLTSHLAIHHVAGATHMMGVEELDGKMQGDNTAAVNRAAPITIEPKPD